VAPFYILVSSFLLFWIAGYAGAAIVVALAGGVACRTLDHVLRNGVRTLGKEESGPHPGGTASISKT
jgi:hypothetical protein